jgi:CII-binding regulator of phage lambda lysogenization HflD
MSEDSFLNTAIKRMKLSEGLRKYKKGSTLKKEPFRRILDSTISKNEIEIRTLERRLDRVRDHVITLLKRWEIVFRRTEQRTYVAENYSDDFSSIAKMIRDELGIRVA